MEKTQEILSIINELISRHNNTSEIKKSNLLTLKEQSDLLFDNHNYIIDKMSSWNSSKKTYADWFNHYVKIKLSYEADLKHYLEKCIDDTSKRNDIFIVNSLQKKFFDYVNCITFIKTIQEELMKKYN